MGYILPINSYRSQQYANRMVDASSNYSRIAELHHVGKVGDLLEGFEEAINQQEKKSEVKKERDSLAASNPQNEVIGYVNPNPVNLSIKHVPVVQKGAVIDAYS